MTAPRSLRELFDQLGLHTVESDDGLAATATINFAAV